MTEVSIVIPTLNDEATLDACLNSITQQNFKKSAYEIIIVDGGSDDRTISIAERYGCEILHEEEGTISYAREKGVRAAEGDYIAFTDADCVVGEKWLRTLLKTLKDASGDVAGVGGPNVTPEDDTRFAKAVGDFFKVISKVGARYGYATDQVTEVHHNPTCNVIYRKDVLEAVGGFNEKLTTVDDEEMDFRIRKQGYRLLFHPNAVVDHYRRPTWSRFAKMAFNYGYGRGQAIRLHRELGKWFHYTPSIVVLLVGGLFLATMVSPLPLLAPIFVFGSGEIGVFGLACYISHQSGQNPLRYFFLMNIWLSLWAIAFPVGLLYQPTSK